MKLSFRTDVPCIALQDRAQDEASGGPSPVAVLLLLLAVVTVLAGSASAHTTHVEADAQVSANDSIVIEGLIAFVDGWVAVHETNESGGPVEPIGHVATRPDAGFLTDVWIPIDPEAWTNGSLPRELVVAVHRDDGDGSFQAEDDEILSSFGHRVLDRFAVDRGDRPVSIRAEAFGPQSLANGTVQVRAVALAEPGHVGVHTDREGKPGVRVGSVRLPAGVHDNVSVPLDVERLPDGNGSAILHAVAYEDRGNRSMEGEDRRVRVGNQTVATQFSVNLSSATVQPDQPPPKNASNRSDEGGNQAPLGIATLLGAVGLAVAKRASAPD